MDKESLFKRWLGSHDMTKMVVMSLYVIPKNERHMDHKAHLNTQEWEQSLSIAMASNLGQSPGRGQLKKHSVFAVKYLQQHTTNTLFIITNRSFPLLFTLPKQRKEAS